MKFNVLALLFFSFFFSIAEAEEIFQPIADIIINPEENDEFIKIEKVYNRCIAVNFFVIETGFYNDSYLADQSALIAKEYFKLMEVHMKEKDIEFDFIYTQQKKFNPTYIYYNLKDKFQTDSPEFLKFIQDDLITCAFQLQILNDLGNVKNYTS